MKTIAVTVSDLHMGFDPRMDNFAGDGRFLRFCERLVQLAQKEDTNLHFILAGDIFELWEMAPPEETHPDTPPELIRANLFFPASGPAGEAAATARGEWQLEQALAAHPEFALGLDVLLEGGARLYYLPGNHDHAMVDPGLQLHLREKLSELTGTEIGQAELPFAHWVFIPDVKLYVEHGHQFADGDSSFEDVTEWRVQAPGYYFLRYVYSRLEGMPDMHVPLHELIRIIINLVFHPEVIDHRAKRYVYQYFAEHEAVGFPLAQGPSVPFVGHLLTAIYEHWKSAGRPLDQGSAELQRACFDLAGRAQVERPDGNTVELENIAGVNLARPKTGFPGKLVNYVSMHARDRYAMGFRDRFARAQKPFPKLEVADGMTVVGGHTHREHHSRLLDAVMATVRYINCGSWASGAHRLGYSAVTDHPNEFRSRLLYLYR